MSRVLIIGSSGAGKTSLAVLLARELSLPHIHLDTFVFGPAWTRRNDGEVVRLLQPLLAQPFWVIDGNYRGVIQQAILERATHIVYLEIGVWQALFRAMRRHFTGQHLQAHQSSAWRFFTVLVPWIVRSHGRRKHFYHQLATELSHRRPDIVWLNLDATQSPEELALECQDWIR